MRKKNIGSVDDQIVDMKGVVDTHIQWLWSKADGAPNFAMRRFRIRPGGKIPLHDHPWEHEIFIMEGKGIVFTPDQKDDVKEGDTLFVPGGERHGYENNGEEDLIFICMIPNSGDNRG